MDHCAHGTQKVSSSTSRFQLVRLRKYEYVYVLKVNLSISKFRRRQINVKSIRKPVVSFEKKGLSACKFHRKSVFHPKPDQHRVKIAIFEGN